MKLNIDTTGVTFLCTREPQAKVNRETGVPKVDRETGEAQWQVQVAALDSTGGEVLQVTVAGRPDVGVGSPVAVEDLVAIPWSQGDRSGVAYRASAIQSLGASLAGLTGAGPASRSTTPPAKQAAEPPPGPSSSAHREGGSGRPSCDLKERTMVRSETPPLPPQPGDGLVALVEIAVKLIWIGFKFKLRLIEWGVLFPMLSAPVMLTVAAAEQGGRPAATAVGLASLMILAGWRLRYPASFHRLVSGRIWKRWRRWRTYRRPWPHLCAMHGLTVVLNSRVSVPKLHRVRVGYVSDAVTVGMLYGQSTEDWQRASDALAHAFGATSVRVRALKPGWAVIDVHHSDALTSVVPLPNVPCSEGIGVEALTAGVTERGDRWQVRIRGHHLLVAGATGSGKGSVVWSVLAGLGPAIRAGLVHLWVVDPKGGMEFGSGQSLYQRFEHDPDEGTVRLLRDAAAILTERADRLRGVTRSHTPTVEEPLVLLVIDEIAALTAYTTDRKVRTEIEQLLGLILSQGRAVGVNVIAAVQDPSKDVLPFRQLFPTRIALRLTEPSQVAMVLGDSARDRGALCDRIPDTLPGVGYVAEEGSSELVRVRAFHVSDEAISRLCREFAPIVPPEVPSPEVVGQASAA